jgi:antitoxin (DNA-binding transcriptional repressor) of toxin-antitoxin stability system
MKTASVTESKNGLSALLRHVKAGKSVLIFDRNVPVARLEPITPGSLPDDQRLLSLERQGLIRRPTKKGSIAKLLASFPMPKMRVKGEYINPVVAERNEDTR